ncbi:MAG: acetyl-CoA C-acyltransferase, partial [Sulfobacillus sp.]|nr:acetyl-CoA C-acyltransferase [Sulfobacillus sp.]
MLMSRDTEIYLLAGARTPFGSYGGHLRQVNAVELARVAAMAAIERSGIPASAVDLSVVGGVLPSTPDAAYLARHVA